MFSGRQEPAMRIHHVACFLAAVSVVAGCGDPADIEGGTPGLIHVNGVPLADVHVAVYESGDSSAEPLAFGISDSDGRFELRQRESLEGVWLEPGDYSLTIESTGEFPLHWPAKFRSPEETPLKVQWTSAEEQLELNVPEPEMSH
jgi:5-hydroxyisourate hydrolase-like protein (transthyretin family)